MPFIFTCTVRFQDTDAAGVVYFANILSICHEAWEESLAAAGIELASFFRNQSYATPIVHTSGDFFRPLYCGDRLTIHLIPQQLSSDVFEVNYQVFNIAEKLVAQVNIKHVCIHPVSRSRQELPIEIRQWLQINGGKEFN